MVLVVPLYGACCSMTVPVSPLYGACCPIRWCLFPHYMVPFSHYDYMVSVVPMLWCLLFDYIVPVVHPMYGACIPCGVPVGPGCDVIALLPVASSRPLSPQKIDRLAAAASRHVLTPSAAVAAHLSRRRRCAPFVVTDAAQSARDSARPLRLAATRLARFGSQQLATWRIKMATIDRGNRWRSGDNRWRTAAE